MDNNFTAVFEQDGEWWIGYVEELPGANTQGRTLEEARENLKEAVALVLEANRELAERQIAGKTVGHGCELLREGGRHSVYWNPKATKTSAIPRHNEIRDPLAKGICKDLEVPEP